MQTNWFSICFHKPFSPRAQQHRRAWDRFQLFACIVSIKIQKALFEKLQSRPRNNRRAPVPRNAARRGSVDLPRRKKVHRNRNRTRRARGWSSSSGHDSGSSEPDPRCETADADASCAWIHEGGPDPSSLYGRRHHRLLARLAAPAVSGLSLSPWLRDRLAVSRSLSNPLAEGSSRTRIHTYWLSTHTDSPTLGGGASFKRKTRSGGFYNVAARGSHSRSFTF